jgi:hypothetical protein
MKKNAKIITTLLLVLATSMIICESRASGPYYPVITLSPNQGYSTIMISGSSFKANDQIIILYDGVRQPTIPTTVKVIDNDNYPEDQTFTALINVPDPLAVGSHNITAIDTLGNKASATFIVLNMTGPQGLQGVAGLQGAAGLQGIQGIQGVSGENGTNGINGLNFNTTGTILVVNGTNGLNGLNGSDGKDGINGLNGINGANGINGKDGTDGVNGTQGLVGAQGPSGNVVYSNPTATPNLNIQYLGIIAAALLIFTSAMIIVYRKS